MKNFSCIGLINIKIMLKGWQWKYVKADKKKQQHQQKNKKQKKKKNSIKHC